MNIKPHVLLIDDELEILEVLKLILTHAGFEVSVAENGETALTKLGENNFNVVVCDYKMPKMDGISLLKIVRQHKDYTPFIFFSGNSDESHNLEMIGLGAFEILQKTEINGLVKVLHNTLKQNEALKYIDGRGQSDKTVETDEFLKLLHSTGS